MRSMIMMGAAALLMVAGCAEPSSDRPSVSDISVTQIGQQSIDERSSYRALGDVSFVASQTYLIRNESGQEEPQMLLANLTVWAGAVLEQETSPRYFPLLDGEFEFECSQYVNVRISEEDDWGPLRCEIQPVALFFADADANLVAMPGSPAAETSGQSQTVSTEGG